MNQIARAIAYQLLFPALVATALFISFAAFPTAVSADTISSRTAQILPPNQQNCQQVAVGNFTSYVYNNAVHSFEFTVPDASYVAIGGTVGNTTIPFNQMSRKIDPQGALRVHVDINSVSLTGTLPISVTLISSKGPGQPTCVLVVTATTGSGPIITTPMYPISGGPSSSSSGSTSGGSSSGGTQGGSQTGSTGGSTSQSGTKTGSKSSTSTVSTSTTATGTAAGTGKGLCQSDAAAYRVWLILLVLYALIVGAALWAEFPMSLSWARTPERIATIILGLLLVLLAFWYFSVSCRAALWMPLLAFLIALLGLLAAFWNHPRVTRLLLVQEKKM